MRLPPKLNDRLPNERRTKTAARAHGRSRSVCRLVKIDVWARRLVGREPGAEWPHAWAGLPTGAQAELRAFRVHGGCHSDGGGAVSPERLIASIGSHSCKPTPQSA